MRDEVEVQTQESYESGRMTLCFRMRQAPRPATRGICDGLHLFDLEKTIGESKQHTRASDKNCSCYKIHEREDVGEKSSLWQRGCRLRLKLVHHSVEFNQRSH